MSSRELPITMGGIIRTNDPRAAWTAVQQFVKWNLILSLTQCRMGCENPGQSETRTQKTVMSLASYA